MKKILVLLSLVAFVAVNVSVAQTPQAAAKETKKETVSNATEKPAAHACCKGGSMKNCSSSQMKSCSPAEKAACAKPLPSRFREASVPRQGQCLKQHCKSNPAPLLRMRTTLRPWCAVLYHQLQNLNLTQSGLS